jgi:hypothetical protein
VLGVPHVYEEFDDDHTDVDYRKNRFLPVSAKALSALAEPVVPGLSDPAALIDGDP